MALPLVARRIDAGLAPTPTHHPRLMIARQMSDPFRLALPHHVGAEALSAEPETVRRAQLLRLHALSRPGIFRSVDPPVQPSRLQPLIGYEASTVHGVLVIATTL